MSKNLSVKYYQENKERLKKKCENYQIYLKKKKRKSHNMVVKVTKIFQKMKKINWLSAVKIL